MLADDQLGLIVTSDLLAQRLVSEGVAPARLTVAPLGADDTTTSPGSALECDQLLARVHVEGAFTLSAGTIEPRKNIEGLVAAHALARRHTPELGPLVIVGPRGWSDVDTGDAVVLGEVARGVLNELYRRATVVAYVPRAEGWGLPPVEALHAGTRVVASTTVPSVSANEEVELAAWDDVAGIADALSRAVTSSRDPEAVARRQRSVAALTWRACAAAHVGAWQ
jgi:glycosyltransferase involved in cell wall biosynthesis